MRNVDLKIIVLLLSLLVFFSFWRVGRISFVMSSCFRSCVRQSEPTGIHLDGF